MKTLWIKIWGKDFTVEFNDVYTRKIDKMYLEKMLENSVDWKTNYKGAEEALDYLITLMTNLTQEQIDELSISDFNKVIDTIKEIKSPSEEEVK